MKSGVDVGGGDGGAITDVTSHSIIWWWSDWHLTCSTLLWITSQGPLCGLVGSALDHIRPGFESRRGHVWRVFDLWLRFITFRCLSAHSAYQVLKSGRKTSIIIINMDYFILSPAWECSIHVMGSYEIKCIW